jgi:hypothetical protein
MPAPAVHGAVAGVHVCYALQLNTSLQKRNGELHVRVAGDGTRHNVMTMHQLQQALVNAPGKVTRTPWVMGQLLVMAYPIMALTATVVLQERCVWV